MGYFCMPKTLLSGDYCCHGATQALFELSSCQLSIEQREAPKDLTQISIITLR